MYKLNTSIHMHYLVLIRGCFIRHFRHISREPIFILTVKNFVLFFKSR